MKEPNHDITPRSRWRKQCRQSAQGEAQPAAPKRRKPSLWIECYTLLHDLVYILVFVTILFVFALRVVSVSGPVYVSHLGGQGLCGPPQQCVLFRLRHSKRGRGGSAGAPV